MIQAIKNQLRLKPIYYRQVSNVAGLGCLVGIFIFVFFSESLMILVGIDTNKPIRQMELIETVMGLGTIFLVMVFSVFSMALLSIYIFYSFKCAIGAITPRELKYITFKGQYPEHWYK